MSNSAPIARWRTSQGVLKQSWSATRSLPRTLTEERPAIKRRPWHDHLFAFLGVCTYLMPAVALIALLLRN